MATLIGGIQMVGKADFMKREEALEKEINEKREERKPWEGEEEDGTDRGSP